MAAEHKPTPKIAVAIARELAGFPWAALQPVATPARSSSPERIVNPRHEIMMPFGDGPHHEPIR